MTHYDTLGLTPDASPADVRAAYRRLVRRHHPDHGGAGGAAMAALTEAHRVLSDPARRAVYDASLRTGSAAGSAAAGGTGPSGVWARPAASPLRRDLAPARMPWKLMAIMFAAGALVVLVAAALYEPAPPAPVDRVLEPGSCVVVEPNGDAREVVCAGTPRQREVAVLVPEGDRCPNGTDAHRDEQGRGTACLRAVPATTP